MSRRKEYKWAVNVCIVVIVVLVFVPVRANEQEHSVPVGIYDPYYATLERRMEAASPAPLPRTILWIGGVAAGLSILAGAAIFLLRMHIRVRLARLEAADARLRESEERFRQLVESTGDIIFTLDMDQRHTGVYGRWLEQPGQSVDIYLGKSAATIFGEAAHVHTEANLRALQGESVVYEWTVPAEGGTQYFQTSLAPLRDDAGVITGIVGIGRDITTLKRTEAALREGEARYRSLFQNNRAVMLIIDLDSSRIVDANPAAVAYYGWSRDVFCGMRIDEVNVMSGAEVQAEMNRAQQEGRSYFLFRHRRADGSIRDVEVYRGPITLGDHPLFYTIVHDVTERHRAERDLQAWQALMQYIIKHDPNAIAVFDKEMHYVFVSDRYLQDYRVTEKDVIGRHHYEVFSDIAEPVRETHRRVLAGEVLHEEDDRYERQDGTVDWVRWECRPWHLADGEIGGIVLYTEVITARKQMEIALRALNVELEQRVAQRTAELQATNQELEAFAYSVSHDLRAPLRAMDGFSAALLSRYAGQLDAQGQHYLDRIQTASQRMGALINDLLDLSRVTRSEMSCESVDLSALGREVIAELQGRDPTRAVSVIIAEGILVQGDRHLLRIALQDLLDNAWKFTGPCVQARIELGVTVQEGERVYFVRDNGVGFDMAYADKLFTPFQRLHAMDVFPGTGIGLVTVRRIVARHGGRIWTEAAEGKGATFFFTLGGVA